MMGKLKKKLNSRKTTEGNTLRIVSPIAKYDLEGNIVCVICKSVIKSATLWRVHVNSKLHKLRLQEAKNFNKSSIAVSLQTRIPQREETTTKCYNNISDLNTKQLLKVKPSKNDIKATKSLNTNQESKSTPVSTTSLPEMFFDDPSVDAKIRHVDYKGNCDDEWDKFQREIKEESVTSKKLIAGEQENSAVEREIIEINEQIHQWKKVLSLEQKLKKIDKINKNCLKYDFAEEYFSDEGDLDENLDWRSKKFLQ